MRLTKLKTLLMMFPVAFSLTAQDEFFDDVYFSSDRNKKSKTETQKNIPAKKETSAAVAYTRDVDEYNRRYTSSSESFYSDDAEMEDTVMVQKNQRTSDSEYMERIIRYHSPSKITIAGADQVDLYLSDGYYAYGYDTEYTDNGTQVNVNINMGDGWEPYSYYSWYNPWYYRPWRYSWHNPVWNWGWSWGLYAGFYDPWYYGWYSPYYYPHYHHRYYYGNYGHGYYSSSRSAGRAYVGGRSSATYNSRNRMSSGSNYSSSGRSSSLRSSSAGNRTSSSNSSSVSSGRGTSSSPRYVEGVTSSRRSSSVTISTPASTGRTRVTTTSPSGNSSSSRSSSGTSSNTYSQGRSSSSSSRSATPSYSTPSTSSRSSSVSSGSTGGGRSSSGSGGGRSGGSRGR